MDGDFFGAVGRLGRSAAEDLASVIRGGGFLNPFLPALCMEKRFNAAGGVPSLKGVLDCFEGLRNAPLLVPVLREETLEQVERVVRDAAGTVLDGLLLSVAARRIDAGSLEPAGLVEDFVLDVLDNEFVSARGGLIELLGPPGCDNARRLLRPIAGEMADVLLRRPDARRIHVSRKYRITADTDLLGGGDG